MQKAAGGTLSDRIGRRPMIWISILGALPFTLMLRYASLFCTAVPTIVIGMLVWFLPNLEKGRAPRSA
ncbi:MAG: hypothetical protein IH604_04710 [Burkholderiales bacterium]|nr:hypothetical protein [Burkholderiales bacterium]